MRLNFFIKFWWTVVHFLLCSTIVDNLLECDQDGLITNFIAGYEIDFAFVIMYELHKRAFEN